MIDHLSTYATDFELSKEFYTKCFETLGANLEAQFVTDWDKEFPTCRCCAFGQNGQTTFWIIEAKESASPRHIAFSADSRDVVDAFYRAAIKAGGKCNGKPGIRSHYHPNYYGAFIIDPDGNDIEAVCHQDGA